MSVKRVEVVEKSYVDTLPHPLLSYESRMFVKENPDRKKKEEVKKRKDEPTIFLNCNLPVLQFPLSAHFLLSFHSTHQTGYPYVLIQTFLLLQILMDNLQTPCR